MKKISLLTMTVAAMAVGVVSNSHAANLADPLYMPDNAAVYSKTQIEFGSAFHDGVDQSLSQELGMGVSDSMAVRVYSGITEGDDAIDDFDFGDVGIGMTWRTMKQNNYIFDMKLDYIADTSGKSSSSNPLSLSGMDDERVMVAGEYGVTNGDLTTALEVGYVFFLDEVMNDADDFFYTAEAQWRTSQEWSTNFGYHYIDNWDLSRFTIQENYHVSDDMVAGVYYSYDNRTDYDDSVIGIKISAQW